MEFPRSFYALVLVLSVLLGVALWVYTDHPAGVGLPPSAASSSTPVSTSIASTERATTTVAQKLVATTSPIATTVADFIEVTHGCGPYYNGTCINARSGPGTSFPAILKLRRGMVLQVSGKVAGEGREWYRVVFNEWLRYPERAHKDLYVAADLVRYIPGERIQTLLSGASMTTHKRIVVDRSSQTLVAYDGSEVFMRAKISTGIELTPTPRGSFVIYKKTPSRYMQGPIEGITTHEYDLPGVPWNMYFTQQGAVIHGAYWHNHFGEPWSNGCVNLPPDEARTLYDWAPIGTVVVVKD